MGFSDLTSSSRGPGVIGTVLAMLVLVGFGCLYMFVYADAGKPDSKRLDVIVREQESELESSQFELSNLKSTLEIGEKFKSQTLEIDSLTRQMKTQAAHIAELEGNLHESQQALDKAKQAFEEYKNAYRKASRESAKGEKIPVLKTNGGVIYQDVIIRNVDAVGMDIRHSQGFKRIEYEDLPSSFQDRFQFDPDQKKKAVEEEINKSDKHVETAEIVTMRDQYNAVSRSIQELKEKNADLDQQIKDFKANDSRYKTAIDMKRSEINTEERRSGGVKKTPQMRAELTQMESAYSDFKAKRSENERQIRANNSSISEKQSKLSQLMIDLSRKIDELREKQNPSDPANN